MYWNMYLLKKLNHKNGLFLQIQKLTLEVIFKMGFFANTVTNF
jgi:hypothetical protein